MGNVHANNNDNRTVPNRPQVEKGENMQASTWTMRKTVADTVIQKVVAVYYESSESERCQQQIRGRFRCAEGQVKETRRRLGG